MDLRQQRGVELAKTRIIRKKGKVWLVPSASGDGTRYTVDLDAKTCTCPDFRSHRAKCKHIFAAAFVSSPANAVNGLGSLERPAMTTERKHRQNYPAYNLAQTLEKDKFQVLLHDLCSGLQAPAPGRGRPRLPLPDAIFAATFKVYSTLSGRRFMSDLREARERGWISRVPCYNTIFNVLGKSDLFPILRNLVARTAQPLAAVEQYVAADSSGFSTSRFIRWTDVKSGREQRQHEWVKCHLMCGVKTNIVTAIEIAGPNAADSKLLSPLLATTAEAFRMVEVSADKAYSSRENLRLINSYGALPFVLFQHHVTGKGGGIWERMYHYFEFRHKDYMDHYHRRSNVESTFSMIKRKFGDAVRSRTDVSMKNEVLCKVLCHNIVVLIHEMAELQIDVEFWPPELDKAPQPIGMSHEDVG